MSGGPDEDAPAVNHADGVARLMGDAALFARVLARFRKEYRDAAGAIHGALAGGDATLALRLVHTLKGAAGMIEAQALRRAAQALEQQLHSAGDPYAGLARLEGALDRVMRELDAAALASPPPPRAPATLSAPSAAHRDARARLWALLDEGNGDAVDLVREAEATLRLEMGDAVYDQVAEAIESFDFDAALALMK